MQNEHNNAQKVEWCDAKEVHARFGISRTPLYGLINDGLVRSTSLQKDGSKRGKRLFHCQSIRDYLESKATGGLTIQKILPQTTPAEISMMTEILKDKHAAGGF